jgi:hypothetical protein
MLGAKIVVLRNKKFRDIFILFMLYIHNKLL